MWRDKGGGDCPEGDCPDTALCIAARTFTVSVVTAAHDYWSDYRA